MSRDMKGRRTSRGQVLVIVAGGMIGLIALVGLVVDGGYAWGRQRMTQSGADAIANAGASVIAQNVAGTNPKKTDGDVGCAVAAAATANGMQGVVAFYTDWQGKLLTTGEQVGPCNAGGGSAVPVCNGGDVAPCESGGVKTTGNQTFGTYMVRALGVSTLTTSADATAITGTLGGCPPGTSCPLVPLTIAITTDICDGSGKAIVGSSLWPIVDPADADSTNEANVALCKTGPGSFGGLDLGGPGCDMKDDFAVPCEALVPIPSWLQTSTGNIKTHIEGLNQYAGPVLGVADDEIVLLPMHDNTCKNDQPDSALPPCPDGAWSGVGNNTFYHVPYFTGFMVDRAFDKIAPCDSAPGEPAPVGGNGSGSCLKGWFVKLVLTGPVGGPGSGNPQDPASIGVQLIN